MGLFDSIFGGGGEKKEVMHLRQVHRPLTQKERYELDKVGRKCDAEYDAMGDDWRIEKSIERHQKKSQKRQ